MIAATSPSWRHSLLLPEVYHPTIRGRRHRNGAYYQGIMKRHAHAQFRQPRAIALHGLILHGRATNVVPPIRTDVDDVQRPIRVFTGQFSKPPEGLTTFGFHYLTRWRIRSIGTKKEKVLANLPDRATDSAASASKVKAEDLSLRPDRRGQDDAGRR